MSEWKYSKSRIEREQANFATNDSPQEPAPALRGIIEISERSFMGVELAHGEKTEKESPRAGAKSVSRKALCRIMRGQTRAFCQTRLREFARGEFHIGILAAPTYRPANFENVRVNSRRALPSLLLPRVCAVIHVVSNIPLSSFIPLYSALHSCYSRSSGPPLTLILNYLCLSPCARELPSITLSHPLARPIFIHHGAPSRRSPPLSPPSPALYYFTSIPSLSPSHARALAPYLFLWLSIHSSPSLSSILIHTPCAPPPVLFYFILLRFPSFALFSFIFIPSQPSPIFLLFRALSHFFLSPFSPVLAAT